MTPEEVRAIIEDGDMSVVSKLLIKQSEELYKVSTLLTGEGDYEKAIEGVLVAQATLLLGMSYVWERLGSIRAEIATLREIYDGETETVG